MNDKSAINIMVIDDDILMLKLIGLMLVDLGHSQISYFDKSLDALRELDSPDTIPNIILLDINMPTMDGIEFIRYLARHGYSGGLILVSGEDKRMLQSVEKLAKAHNLSVLGTLRKPPSREYLATLISKCTSVVTATPCSINKCYDAESVRDAIANGELINYYQPKVAISTGEIIAVETLVRWRHPTDGLVSPNYFIPIAEAHGLINGLTRTVFTNALKQTKYWHTSGLNLQVAVNVSMDDLAEVEFADFIISETLAAGITPESVVLEITESRLMQNFTAVLDVISRLRLKRFRLSIDDFGTGHSSLAQLRDLPFDELKIDRSFTHGAWQDERLKALFEGSIHLANKLGMEVVSEGVEDVNDWNFLRMMGGHLAQGHFIAPPMPAMELPNWIDKWNVTIQREMDRGCCRFT